MRRVLLRAAGIEALAGEEAIAEVLQPIAPNACGPMRPRDYRLKAIRRHRAHEDARLPLEYAVGERVLVRYLGRPKGRYHWLPSSITAAGGLGRIRTPVYNTWYHSADLGMLRYRAGLSQAQRATYGCRVEEMDLGCVRR